MPHNPREIVLGPSARSRIMKGLDLVADVTKLTLGPGGRGVALARPHGARITRDGVTVARELDGVPDALASMGIMLGRHAAATTVEVGGDGTTTALLLTREIARRAVHAVEIGCAPVSVRAGIEQAATRALNHIKALSRRVSSVSELERLATQAANGDAAVGSIVAEALDTVGNTGIVNISDIVLDDLTVEYQQGMILPEGPAHAGLAPRAPATSTVLHNPLVFLASMPLRGLHDCLTAMSIAVAAERPLLIVCEDIAGDALSVLLANHQRGTMAVQWVKPPSFGTNRHFWLEDIALLTGADVLCHDKGSDPAALCAAQLGTCTSATIEQFQTLLEVPPCDGVAERAAQLRRQAEHEPNTYDKEKLLERAARLTSGVATIKVGAPTEAEARERRDRVDDALRAAVAAFSGGVVPGAGTALLSAARSLDGHDPVDFDVKMGFQALKSALEQPTWQLAANAAFGRPDFIVGFLQYRARQEPDTMGTQGMDARTGSFVDVTKAGIMDPTSVVVTALQQAASVAAMLCTCEVAIATKESEYERHWTGEQPLHRAAHPAGGLR